MIERAHTFGSHGGLVGIVTEPEGGARRGAPALLLFNIGLNHRVGPGRLNVELAREVARRGLATLRFDLSGLGDSEPRPDARPDLERAVLDLREAMDFLERRLGASGFVVAGLCSGTDGAHAAAVADPRVVGAIFIDGYAYPTAGYQVRRALEKVRWVFTEPFRVGRWLRRATRRLRRLNPDDDVETRVSEPIFDREYPPAPAVRADLERLLARGARLLFLYSVDAWFINSRGQFARMLGWRRLPPGLDVEYWTDVDHTFSTLAPRRRLVAHLGAWVEERFAPPREAVRRAGES